MASALVKEFKEFAMKGSVVDLAVGIIIGAAFGAIVKSLVDDIIMPVVGLLLGGVDFTNRYYVLRGGGSLQGNETVEAAREAGAVIIAYGKFANNILTFLIVAFAVFLLVKGINRMRRRSKNEPMPTTRPCPECTTVIPRAARRCPSCTASVTPLPETPEGPKPA
jgi:large conductance mechanosensitive channel